MSAFEKFILEPTDDKPGINFDPENDIFEIYKRSFPEDAIFFYDPVIEWMNNFISTTEKSTIIISIKLDYYNTSTSKQLSRLLKDVETRKGNKEVQVFWYYDIDDEEMLESGKKFAALLYLDFRFFEKEEN